MLSPKTENLQSLGDGYEGDGGSDDDDKSNLDESGEIDSSTDRKKQVHLRCEQQRREAIKTGYAELKDLLPSDFAPLGYKMTNASILFRTVDYIQKLQQLESQHTEELSKLKSQLVALSMICQNYEQMVRQDAASSSAGNQSLAHIKFRMFKELMDSWFASFSCHVQTDNYALLTGSLLSWMEKEADMESVLPVMTRCLGGPSASNTS